MVGFLKRLFGSTTEPAIDRKLNHPCDLRKGDFLKFQFLPQSELSGKTFEVYKVNTYTYDGVDYPEMIIKDREGNIFFMMIEEEDGGEYVGLSKKVPKAMIREIIPQNKLDEILKKGTGKFLHIDEKSQFPGFEKWLSMYYIETDENKGSFIKGDFRGNVNGKVENFKSHFLMDSSNEYALEIEVYGDGEIELSATVYHEINVIAEIYPGSLEKK